MNLPTVEITAPVLPSVLPNDHQELMNLFYMHWQNLSAKVSENNASLQEGCDDVFVNPNIEGMMRSPNQYEIAAVMPAKVNAAVILGNFNYQVTNGGFLQYDDNGYSESVDFVEKMLEGAQRLEIEEAEEVLELVREFKQIKANEERNSRSSYGGYDDEDEEDYSNTYGHLDSKFYEKCRESLMQQILDRFDEIAGMAVMHGAYSNKGRRAA